MFLHHFLQQLLLNPKSRSIDIKNMSKKSYWDLTNIYHKGQKKILCSAKSGQNWETTEPRGIQKPILDNAFSNN